ncbi:TetR/AcrR family transcriptional regulator [Microbacterium sp. MYb66]|jgi:AcrR family transcriptional regulator|uniref:TetR/AcrR family transcriptional regulator n=1 Tax=Microbacterium sp. MYb66 TaxID=1848692 RepID=UPI000CFFD84F|nr:TetR/AcrR family transcriptional regulator [Microbacterium sp. MYb66]PRA79736.1 TetR family transcriptional regulator [Microbacterium sp. MYb66]
MSEAKIVRRGTKGERTRERILQAALELFSEQGFTGTSVRDIAARAEMTHAGLLHHFPSKDGMLVEILQYSEQQDEINARRFSDYGIDRLFAWIIDVVEVNVSRPDRVTLYVRLSAEATDAEHPARAYFTRRYTRIVAALEGAFAEHFVVSPPSYELSAREAAVSIVALMDGLQLQWLLLPGTIDMPTLVRTHLASLGIHVPAHPWIEGPSRD